MKSIFKFNYIFIVLLFSLLFSCGRKEQNLSGKITIEDYKIQSVDMPKTIEFAGEEVPLDLYYVWESLERELTVNTYWHSSTLLTLKRTGRWFPIIEPILKEHGIPDDFKYLSLIESAFQNVTSPAGAKGFWQILKGTGKDYGLEINSEVDERYHVEKSTIAACEYLKDGYKKYGNWTMVAASYNFGRSGISKQIDKQKTTDYYNLKLGEETERYLFRILAIKLIVNKPESFGFFIKKKEYYKPLTTKNLMVKKGVSNWGIFAKEYGISYRMLKELNPWLRKELLTNKRKKVYQIKIPD